LTALLAATLQQVRSAESDPAAMARAADLLARAAGPGPTSWEVEPSRLLVNEVPIPNGAPGVAMVRAALTRHHIRRLTIPGRTDATRWSDLAATLESAGGLYPAPEHFAHAVQAAVPGSDVTLATGAMPEVAEDEGPSPASLHRAPVSPFTEAEPSLVSRAADRAALSVRLEPLIEAGMAAAQRWDWDGIATMLLKLHALEGNANDAERWIIAQERHRVVTSDVLQGLVRELPSLGAGASLSRAFTTLGGDAVEAILEALADEPSRQARHSYLAALVSVEHAEPALLEALAPSTPAVVLRDVIEVVGRRRIERAVPTLAAMRHHADERVRTAAMRALEDIGTAEAMAALR
jgi:hypothetical protein